MMFSHQDISEPETRWESVAMSSYKAHPAQEKLPENEVLDEKDEGENEWVLVSMKETIESELPEKEKSVSAKISSKKEMRPLLHALRLTREMSDTKYNRVFKRPLPHNYGHANIKPVTDENYLKTFNIKCRARNEVYKSALNRMKDTSDNKNLENKRSKSESYVVPEIETEVVKVSYQVSEDNNDAAQAQPKTELNMYERLSWPDGTSDEQRSLDPKSYSVLPPSLLNQIAPAGISVKRSEPVSNLLCTE